MIRFVTNSFHRAKLIPTALVLLAISSPPVVAQNKLYNPLSLPSNQEVSDRLSPEDIPTGQGGFFRDYTIELNQGDQISIDLSSDSFDAIVSLIAADGSTLAENDDGPDGSTNSLLFARVPKTGKYIIRVRAFGETGTGPFRLKFTHLRPI